MFARFAVDVENINVKDDLLLEERALPCLLPITADHQQVSDEVVDELGEPAQFNLDLLALEEITLQQLVDTAHSSGFPRQHPAAQPQPSFTRQKIRDVRVFCNFLALPGKKCSFNVRLKEQVPRGIDVIEGTIRAFLTDDRRQKYSDNPRLYQLSMADDQTGEYVAPIQLDSACQNISCFTVTPLPDAQLFLFPARTQLLPSPVQGVALTVEVRSADSKSVKRLITFPADLLLEKVETVLQSKLPVNSITFGSLRIRYGPAELLNSQRYDFGVGCGTSLTISERTVCSLFRFGVTELIVDGKVQEQEPSASGQETSLDNVKRLDEEEARAYQQFEVIKINKFGVRQQRVIGIDAERVYNMRPSSEVGKTKNPERQIEDIEVIRDFRDRPTFCEIEYSKASKYDTDKIECRNAFDCAMLVEKLRMLKKIHGRKELKKSETSFSRFLGKFPFGK